MTFYYLEREMFQKTLKKAMKKSIFKTVAAFALSVVIAISCMTSVSADAATKTNPDTLNYSIVVKDDSTSVIGEVSTVNVVTYYQRIKLAGSDAATKKINKTLLKASKVYDPETIIEEACYAADNTDMFDGNVFYDFYNSFITDRTKDYISIVVTREWWAGGVSNNFEFGYVFDLNTGKKISITKASGKSLSYIKERLMGNIIADGFTVEDDVIENFKKMKASDFNYYINSDGLCVVVINPYTIGNGGAVVEYVIE